MTSKLPPGEEEEEKENEVIKGYHLQKKDKGQTPSDLSHINKHDKAIHFRLNDSGGVVGVKTFEDVLEIVGTFGRWNITIFILCSIVTFVNAFTSMTYEFLGATPDYWCHVGPLVDANWTKGQIFDLAIPLQHSNESEWKRCKMYNYNYSLAVEMEYEAAITNLDRLIVANDSTPIHCHSRDFDTSVYKSTVTIEWDLVCERRALYSTTQAVSQFGTLLGSILSGYFLDKFGRRPVILTLTVLGLASSIAAALSPSYIFYAVMRALISCSITGVYMGCFVAMMELCTPSQRSSIAVWFVMPWAIGYMMVPGIAFIIRPWRWLQMAYSVPSLFLLSYFWLLPESPRWLISQGRPEKAVEILYEGAKVNGRMVPPKDALVISLTAMMPSKKASSNLTISERIVSNIKYIFALMIRADLRVKALICFFCWFTSSMVYFGVSLNSDNLSVDPYIYVFLGGVIEVVAYLLLWLLLTYLGRKISMIGLFGLCAITIATIAVLQATEQEVSSGLMMFLSLSGKLAITAVFHLIYIFTAELFPTQYRSLAIGESSFLSRIGSIFSPYINDMLGAAITWGPSAVFASVSVVAACLSLILPETKGANMTEEDNPIDTEVSQETKIPETQADFNGAVFQTQSISMRH